MIDLERPTPPERGPFAPTRPRMRGPYLIRNPLKAAAVATRDAALHLLSPPSADVPAAPGAILMANWGHLGDVVTTLGVARLLRKRFPAARLGILAGSWGAAAARESGLFDAVHIADHWQVNRSAIPASEKRNRYRSTRAIALAEMRSQAYDLAIDCYPFQPAAHPLFRQVGIPVRAGFTSAGYGPLLTHPVRWADRSQPIADHYADLLDALWPDHLLAPGDLRSVADRPLPPGERFGLRQPYLVLHPGAGAAYKDWGTARWAALAARLRSDSRTAAFHIVVTGAGAGEIAVADALEHGDPTLHNLAGKADWPGFAAILAHAAAVVCPDTVTAHLASRYDTPVLAIFTGANDPRQWGPYSPHGHVIVQDVICAPCNRAGCAPMGCIAQTTADQVFDAVVRILANPAAPLAQR